MDARYDAAVREVAALLPEAVDLYADMGGTWIPEIVFPTVKAHPADPDTVAGIDDGSLDDNEFSHRWYVDVGGGTRTEISDLGIDADPGEVAAWIRAHI